MKSVPNEPNETVPQELYDELELMDTSKELNFYASDGYEEFLEDSDEDELEWWDD